MAIAAAVVIVPVGVLFFISGLIVNFIQVISDKSLPDRADEVEAVKLSELFYGRHFRVVGLRAGERLLGSSSYYSDVSEKLSCSSDLGFIFVPTKNVITAKKSSNYGHGFISNRLNQDTYYIRALKEHVDTASDPSSIDQWVQEFEHLEEEGDQEFSVEALLLLQKSFLEKQCDNATFWRYFRFSNQ